MTTTLCLDLKTQRLFESYLLGQAAPSDPTGRLKEKLNKTRI